LVLLRARLASASPLTGARRVARVGRSTAPLLVVRVG
jgi:hypothetical protein